MNKKFNSKFNGERKRKKYQKFITSSPGYISLAARRTSTLFLCTVYIVFPEQEWRTKLSKKYKFCTRAIYLSKIGTKSCKEFFFLIKTMVLTIYFKIMGIFEIIYVLKYLKSRIIFNFIPKFIIIC